MPTIRLAVLATLSLLSCTRCIHAARVQVRIQGLDPQQERNARAFMELAREAERDLDPARIRLLHRRAERQILRSLEPFGLYRASVRGKLSAEGGLWQAHYRVEPGEPVLLTRVSIELSGPGAAVPELLEARRAHPLRQGDPLRHDLHEQGRDELLTTALESGFLDARLAVSSIEVDLAAYAAVLELRLETGPRYYFGELIFEQDVIDEELLRSFAEFEPGDPYSASKLLALQSTLGGSGYFGRVAVDSRRDRAGADRRVPIHVQLAPGRSQRWLVGLGYGTDTGVRGRLGLELRRLNRAGHRLSLDLSIAARESAARANYTIPQPRPRGQLLQGSLGYDDTDSRSRISRSAHAGVGVSRTVGKRRGGLNLGYYLEDWEVGSDSGRSRNLILEANLATLRTEDRFFPREGSSFRLRLGGALEPLLAEQDFLQLRGELRYVRTLIKPLRMLARVSAGYIWVEDFRALPGSLRFFAGGDNSVRGYAYEELGELDEQGQVIGGPALLTTTLELDLYPLGEDSIWGAAVFYDLGGAAYRLGDRLAAGVGVGARVRTPVGPLRLDVAWGLDREDTPVRLHLTLGPDL